MPTAAWTHPKITEWNILTFSSCLYNAIMLKPARFLLDVATTSIFFAEPRELSRLYTLAYIASGGNETTTRTIEWLASTGNGAQQVG